MKRAYNFSAGPASLPQTVLQQAGTEILNWHDTGCSIMEMSHRGAEFIGVAQKAEQDLRQLMAIPNNYKVLFMHGGATMQFAAIPLNLLGDKTTADYIDTGAWSKKAIAEAKKYCTVNIAASTADSNYRQVPSQEQLNLNPDAAYVHYTPNETIGGLEFDYIPETNGVPLVADMSSTILSRPIDVSKFGLIYAGAQKNIGPAGIAVVIVREDLLGKTAAIAPSLFNYQTQAASDSMQNTPPTYSWYLAGLVFEWLLAGGGLEAMAKRNLHKSQLLYDYIDSTDFYHNPIAVNNRSWMNVPFTLADANLDAEFLQGATSRGLLALKGHRSVGGMRASIYNAMEQEGIAALVNYMREFATAHSK